MAFIGNNPKWNTSTYTPQSADPTNPVEGMVFRSDGTSRAKGLWEYRDSAWIAVGSGSDLDTFLSEDFGGTSASDFSTGNNATFLGGGTLDGTLADDTSTPIAGSKSITYTMSTSSANDYIASPVIDLDLKQRGNFAGANLYFTYDGDDDDIKFVIYDVTNTQILTSELALIKSKGNPTRFSVSFNIPTSCTQLRYGFQVITGNSTKVLEFDDIQLSSNPFVLSDLDQEQLIALNTHNGYGSTATKIRRFTNIEQNTGTQIISVIQDSTNGDSFTALVDCEVHVTLTDQANAVAATGLSLNSNQLTTDVFSITQANRLVMESIAAADSLSGVSWSGNISAGDVLRVHTNGVATGSNADRTKVFIFAKKKSASIVAPLDNVPPIKARVVNTTTSLASGTSYYMDFDGVDFDADGLVSGEGSGHVTTTNTGWKYTVPVTGKYRVNAQIQLAAENNLDAGERLQLFVRADNVNVARQTKSAHFTSAGNTDNMSSIDTLAEFTAGQRIEIVFSQNSGASMSLDGDDTASYVSITREDQNATLGSFPVPLVATVVDQKSSGTNGGTATSGSWQTRDLNTTGGDFDKFATLSSNQITLDPGKYLIQAKAPAFQVGGHKAKLYDITNAADVQIGSAENSGGSAATGTSSEIYAVVSITSATTYEIQHRVASTVATSGFGGTDPSLAAVEIFTTVTITKLL